MGKKKDSFDRGFGYRMGRDMAKLVQSLILFGIIGIIYLVLDVK